MPLALHERTRFDATTPEAIAAIDEYLGYGPSDLRSCRCPFSANHTHGDRSPSAVRGVNNNGERYFKCYVCGFSMTAIVVFRYRETGTTFEPGDEVPQLDPKEYARWTDLLLLRAGIVEPENLLRPCPREALPKRHTKLQKNPERCRTLLQEVHRVAEETFQLKQLRFPEDPSSLLSARFVKQRLSRNARATLGNVTLTEILACLDMLDGHSITKTARSKPYGRNSSPYYLPVWSTEEQPMRTPVEEQEPEPRLVPKPRPTPAKSTSAPAPAQEPPRPVYTETIAQMMQRQQKEYHARRGGIQLQKKNPSPEPTPDIRRVENPDGTVSWYMDGRKLS